MSRLNRPNQSAEKKNEDDNWMLEDLSPVEINWSTADYTPVSYHIMTTDR